MQTQVVSKPFHLNDLTKRIEEMLENNDQKKEKNCSEIKTVNNEDKDTKKD